MSARHHDMPSHGQDLRHAQGDYLDDVARYDDLSWDSPHPDAPHSEPDRRPRALRRWLPFCFASSCPLEGDHMARIKVAAFH